jgi:hypothetical protein
LLYFAAPLILLSLTDDVTALRGLFAEPAGGKGSNRGAGHYAGEPSPAPPPTPEGGTSGGEAEKGEV